MVRKIRRQGAVPPHWMFRDGRPRWGPAPGLRRAGWKGLDLKDARGQWLTRGASIDKASEINAAVASWRAGGAVPAALRAIAPPDAASAPGAPRTATQDPFSIGALIDAWTGGERGDKAASFEFRQLGERTRRDYRGKLKRLLDLLAGFPEPPADAAGRKLYAARLLGVRAASIFTLQPVQSGDHVQHFLRDAYQTLHGRGTKHQASGVMAAAGAWLSWVREHRNTNVGAWAQFKRETPGGRIRVLSWAEIAALVSAADRLGMLSVGDAIVFGVDLTWSQADRLALTWPRVVMTRTADGQVITARALTGEEGRQKTGRIGGTPFLSLGLRRLQAVLERQAAWSFTPTHLIWREPHRGHKRGAPWSADAFRKAFDEVRALAAQTCPSVASARDQDLRDTGFTLCRAAGLGDDGTASRTLQSRRQVANLGDAHYGEIGPAIADPARDQLDLYVEAEILKAGVSL
jgi:hypothetical protein